MDAQNAAESDQTRPAAASSPQPRPAGPEPDGKAKSPTSLRAPSPPRPRPHDAAAASDAPSAARPDDSPPADRDSDAETIVLPGKDGHSPSKARKVRQEDKSESDGDAPKPKPRPSRPDDDADGEAAPACSVAPGNHPADASGKKRVTASAPIDKDRHPPRIKEPGSSGLSSAPASPSSHHQQQHPPHQQQQQHPHPHPHQAQQHQLHSHNHQQQQQQQQQSHQPQHQLQQQQHQHQHPCHHPHPPQQPRRRPSDDATSSPSDSEHPKHQKPSSKPSFRDKLKSGERLLPHKRKAPKDESDDEADLRKARRQRTASLHIDGSRLSKEVRSTPAKPPHEPRPRSVSPKPPPRQHRRSISTQLPFPSNGLNLKKKRLPPPLQPTDYHSDDSSTGGSPRPRSSKLRSLAIPPATDPSTSPAKMAPHKKHLDAHGQTLLARACARGEYETAKQRLGERPEDLNVADYAGNTPLQIAAINGCEDIVKLLIDAGCNLDCVNYDKDTPLLDAVDNGHLGVVRLLLDAGVNPRKANVNGEEPLDRVSDETDNADEIRAALMAARKRAGERRRTSEDRHSHHDGHDVRDSNAPDSPRRSPAATPAAPTGRRSGTVRSTKTRNDLLYVNMDNKELRKAAGRGDEETVARILQVKEGIDDPESMVAAARGGHDLVIQLLLGLGGANADPGPVASLPSEFATPILAAIGQENIKVIELLLEQQGFDPTRRFKGETYYEIARRRQGTNWKEEEQMLKNSYDEYKRSHRDVVKTKSPGGRREREKDRDEKPSRRDEPKDMPKAHKRNHSSPPRDGVVRKKIIGSKITSPREKKRPDLLVNRRGEDDTQKRAPGRVKKDSSLISDSEISPVHPHKPLKAKRAESDVTGLSSEGEAAKPRRKLVSKGELSRERDRQKRAIKEPSSPRDARTDDVSLEKSKLSEKYRDRAKALRRDQLRDHSPGDGATKRHRASLTPDRPSDGDKDHTEVPVKRRKLDGDAQLEKRPNRPSSVDGRPRKPGPPRDTSARPAATGSKKERDDGSKDGHDHRAPPLHGSARNGSVGADKSIHVKSEDVDVPMPDIGQPADTERADLSVTEQHEVERARKSELAEQEVKEEARKRLEAEDKKKRLEAEDKKKQLEAEDKKKKLEAEEKKKKLEAEEKKKQLEAEEKRKKLEAEEKKKQLEAEEKKKQLEAEEKKKQLEAEEKKKQLEAEEKKKQLEDEARKREEEEKARKAEEEKKRREEDEARKRRDRERREAEEAARRREEEKKRLEEKRKREEEEKRRREEEERLHREQLEREAAEEARRRREEEERKERERRERAHREELERKRAAREAEQKRIREEQERIRLDKLPPLLRWLDLCPNPKTPALAEKFRRMLGPRYDSIRQEANGTPAGREGWVLNTHVALLLGEKDLDLSRYTAWEREPVSDIAKQSLWRTEWERYALLSEKLHDLGRQLPGYYGGVDPSVVKHETRQQLANAAWHRFRAMDMFFVKVSDLMYTVPNIPHLRNIELAVEYRELPETEEQAKGWKSLFKWKQDPDAGRFFGFAPRNKYYVNGVMTREDFPVLHQTSRTPFPEVRVPRRGLVQALPGDPDYEQLCMEQGLEDRLKKGPFTPSLPDGNHSSPGSQTTATTPAKAPLVNGTSEHVADGAANDAANGVANGAANEAASGAANGAANGTANGTANGVANGAANDGTAATNGVMTNGTDGP